jgi:hypothetical protein
MALLDCKSINSTFFNGYKVMNRVPVGWVEMMAWVRGERRRGPVHRVRDWLALDRGWDREIVAKAVRQNLAYGRSWVVRCGPGVYGYGWPWRSGDFCGCGSGCEPYVLVK